jgi:hypothetical protein
MAFVLEDRWLVLPLTAPGPGWRDGSGLTNDAKTMAWLMCNNFRRTSRKYRHLSSCELTLEELVAWFKKHVNSRPGVVTYFSNKIEELRGSYCRSRFSKTIENVPWEIFIQLPVAR